MSERIGILGAGVMGGGIAQVMALGGYEVVCADINESALEKGDDTLQNGRFGLGTAVDRGRITADQASSARQLVTFTLDFAAVAACDIVIEAVPEKLELKLDVFKQLDAAAPPHTILASNTSGFSVTALAAVTSRPDKVIGWHWASPVPVMKLAEIARHETTSDETTATVVRLAADVGKNPVVIKDQPRTWGFVANRVYGAMRREAERCVSEGIATPEQVDQLLIDCFRWPAGPFNMGSGARSGWK
jgi:3-hydroxybutyryl-CoA dehydrogenase